MSEKQKMTPVYRIENPSKASTPDGVTSHSELVGQWFSPNLTTALGYLRKSTQTFGRNATPIEGSQLVVAQVPTEQLDALHVSHHPIASEMDVENDNYIVPRDGSIETTVVPLDTIIEGLHGQLGKFDRMQVAQSRVQELVANLALTNSNN